MACPARVSTTRGSATVPVSTRPSVHRFLGRKTDLLVLPNDEVGVALCDFDQTVGDAEVAIPNPHLAPLDRLQRLAWGFGRGRVAGEP